MTSLAETGEAEGTSAVCGIGIEAAASEVSGTRVLSDCRPIGVGDGHRRRRRRRHGRLDLIDRGRSAGGGGSPELSIAGGCGALPLSSSVIAILKVPSTITTTLAPTSSERILEVIVDGSLALSPAGSLNALRAGLLASRRGRGGLGGAARGGNEIRRAGRLGRAGGISLMAFSEAAMRSDGEAGRPAGRVPGSSG